jgi:hypothetical protein
VICQALHKLDCDRFLPFFDVLTPFLALTDSKHASRVCEALEAYMKMVTDNLKFSNATTAAIRYLAEVKQGNIAVREWLFDRIENWIDEWLIINKLKVREQTHDLIKSYVSEEPYVCLFIYFENTC